MQGTVHLFSGGVGIRALAFWGVLLLCASVAELSAQSASTGALTGTVTDPSGAVVANATVTLRSEDTSQSLTTATDESGFYRFSLLPPGEYELTVDAAGFSPFILPDVMIQITEVTRIPLQLSVKGVKETVVVQVPLL